MPASHILETLLGVFYRNRESIYVWAILLAMLAALVLGALGFWLILEHEATNTCNNPAFCP
jgi:hypothetical protein